MKRTIILFSIIILATISSFGQMRMHHKDDKPQKRIEELEKIKLLEVLNLDEKTMLKFFSRRDEYQKKMNELRESSGDLLNQMDKLVKDGNKQQDSELKELINKYLANQAKFNKIRGEFIGSISDILTTRQIAKYLVFERKFRDEIRNLIFKHRMRMPR